MVEYYVAKITTPRKSDTKSGLSKKYEYLQIEGVPCKVIETINNQIKLNPFTSNNKTFTITKKELKKEFTKLKIDKFNNFKNLKSYKIKININEFDIRIKLNNNINKLKKIINKLDAKVIKIFNDKINQLISTQGSVNAITLKKYELYKNKQLDLSANETLGDPIFNRNCRWCPPVNITPEEFLNSKSYPLPIGIRPKDFCLPSELWDSISELVKQILTFKNVKISDDIKKELKGLDIKIDNLIHKCKFCNKEININEYTSNYKSQDNFIEICHRDPNERFIKSNMYWGHGECNRKQGGFDEKSIIKDGLNLLFHNKDYLEDKEIRELLEKLKTL